MKCSRFSLTPTNLQAITPAWLRFEIITPTPITISKGTFIDYRIGWRGAPVRWRTQILRWEPPHLFVDVQRRGPYRLWHHTHSFAPHGSGTLMQDVVRYSLPFGVLGRIVQRMFVRRDLESVFDYRAKRISELISG